MMITSPVAANALFSRKAAGAVGLLVGGLLVAMTILAAPPAFAASVTAGDFTFETTGATAAITGFAGVSTPIVDIPASIDVAGTTYSVTGIADGAFSLQGLTSVTIPNSVTSIGVGAFSRNSLVSVTIPDSVQTIGDSAFGANSTLTSVTIPDSVTSIADYAFEEDALTSVTIPSSVTSIGTGVFMLNRLTSVTIPNSVTSIGERAFSGNNVLASVTIPDSVTSIGERAFSDNALTSVTIPGSVTSIGVDAFVNNPSLVSVLFRGAPPATITPSSSLGNGIGMTAYYIPAFASVFAPGGATTWQGYAVAPAATVAFDLGGHGAAIRSVSVIPGTGVAVPAAPVATGFTFDGWFTQNAGTTAFDFTNIAATATAYAHWTAVAPASGKTLAATGTDAAPVALVGVLVLLLGAFVLGWTRRRRIRSSH